MFKSYGCIAVPGYGAVEYGHYRYRITDDAFVEDIVVSGQTDPPYEVVDAVISVYEGRGLPAAYALCLAIVGLAMAHCQSVHSMIARVERTARLHMNAESKFHLYKNDIERYLVLL